MSVLPPDVISDWSQDFCPWAGIATCVPGFLPLGRHCDAANAGGLVEPLTSVPGFLPLGRHCDAVCGILPHGSRPRISAPGQALRQVPGFLPLGRHCDRPIRSAANPKDGVPRFLPLGRHYDSDPLPPAPPREPRPRISAPGQALRHVPGFPPLGRHCDDVTGLAPQSQDFCPWAGIANRDRNHTKNRRGRPRISAPGQALRNDNVYASQDFCPWAGIATTLEALAKAVPGFLPLGRHCDEPVSWVHPVTVWRPRISAPGQALRCLL